MASHTLLGALLYIFSWAQIESVYKYIKTKMYVTIALFDINDL